MTAEELRAKIREIPDFPKPASLLRHHDPPEGPDAYHQAIDS